MTIVVDTNIIFSACLTPDGRIFEILFNSLPQLQIVSCSYALEELQLHKQKLARLSKRSSTELDILINSVLKQVDFLKEDIIDEKYWLEADTITKGVDSKDINFVALTLQTGGKLWTGDKKLVAHLQIMKFGDVLNTAELYNLLNIS